MPRREIIVGNPALVVIDIQERDFSATVDEGGIPTMPGYADIGGSERRF